MNLISIVKQKNNIALRELLLDWLNILPDAHFITRREKDVLSYYMFIYVMLFREARKTKHKISAVADVLVWNKVFSGESNNEICKALRMSPEHLQICKSQLRKKGAIIDEESCKRIPSVFIPQFENDNTIACKIILKIE